MRRRRSRSLASDVDDLIGHQFGSSMGDSYDSSADGHIAGFCPAVMHKPPYMDVQTVKTNLTVDQAAKLEGQSHCLLLVEPVLLPNLGHTGVDRETLPGDRPLFYPNGKKNCSLGGAVRNALYRSVATPQPQQQGGHGRQQQQGPPSDWAGSSAYYSIPSECSTCYTFNQHSDEASASAAVPAGQGGRFPTDVWGRPMGEDRRMSHATVNKDRRRWRRKPAGNGGEATGARRSNSESVEEVEPGSCSEDQLGRYSAREQEARKGKERHVLAGRTGNDTRAQQRHNQQQRRWPSQNTTNSNDCSFDNFNTAAVENLPVGEGAPTTEDLKPQQGSATTNSTQTSFDVFVAGSAYQRGDSATTTSGWTTVGPSTIGGGGIADVAGRDSEWLAERRAADQEARELVRALKKNSTRLDFLVSGPR